MTSSYYGDPSVDVAASEAVPIHPELQQLVDPLQSGFSWYLPPMATAQYQHPDNGSNNEWHIAGHDMQVLTVTLDPNASMVTEVGSFMMGSSGIEMDVECTCRTQEGWRRVCGGESCVKLLLKNQSPNKGYVGLTPKFPAKIVPIQFGKHVNGALIAQTGTYMAHLGNDVDVACDLDCSCPTFCCAGFGCCRQKISSLSSSGIAFLAAGGTLLFRKLEPGEQITVDSRSVVAMEDTVKLGIVPNGKFCMCCCGGEGCYSTTLTGPGKIFLQSMTFQKFKDAVQVTTMDDRGETV